MPIRMGVFCELGQGGVDLTGVIRELTAAGFDGWAVFEQDVDTTQPGCNPLDERHAQPELPPKRPLDCKSAACRLQAVSDNVMTPYGTIQPVRGARRSRNQ